MEATRAPTSRAAIDTKIAAPLNERVLGSV
ncbi:Uncharacterised protein [Mycobacteroides abscessus subsp. abscessus]|nr:Uncharacterised protein [Mycobacteroides abscessus subsp. abscessus]